MLAEPGQVREQSVPEGPLAQVVHRSMGPRSAKMREKRVLLTDAEI